MNKLVAIAIRHWKPVILWNLLVLGVTITASTVMHSRDRWTVTAQLTTPGTNSNLDANLGVLGSLRNSNYNTSISNGNDLLKMQEKILTSDTLMEKVFRIDPEKKKFNELIDYKALFDIYVDEESPVVTINVKSATPEIAELRANNLIKLFQQRLNELRQQNRVSKRKFSAEELKDAKNNLIQEQQALAKFKQSSQLVDAQEQTKALVTTIDNLTKTRLEILSQIEYNQNIVTTLSNRLQMPPKQAIRSLSLGENKDYQYLKGKRSEVKAELARQRAKYTDNHIVIKELLQQEQALLSQIQTHINQVAAGTSIDTTVNSQGEGRVRLIEKLILSETEASAQQRRAQQIENQINQLKNNLNFIPTQQRKLAELQRNVDVAEGVYKGLVAQVQQTNIDVFDVYPNVEVFEPPKANTKPISPKISLIVLNALLAGIIGSIALLLFLERQNPLLSPQDLQSMRFPLVVSIPQFKDTRLTWELDENKQEKFQRLASAISLQRLTNRRLLITSAIQGEGKTTVTLGLAKALVDLGFRVLMVDGDFLKAELTQQLVYSHHSDSTKSLISLEPNLDFLPTSPQTGNIVRMVSKGSFQKNLAESESSAEYDYVLVDSPPVSTTIATALMSAQICNILFVIKPGMSNSNSVRDSLEQLIKHQAQILGLIVNSVKSPTIKYTSFASNKLR